MTKKIKIVGFALFLIVILSACATGDPENDENGKASEDNDEVTIAIRENVTSIDPHDGSTSVSNAVQGSMYEGLYELGEDGEMQPALATDYEESEDGKEYTFELREDVEFQDGEELDAQTVKDNFDRILDSDGSLAAYRAIEYVDDVEVLDDHEVQVNLEEPNNQFINKLENIYMVSSKALEDDVDISQEAVGTGPFELEEWSEGESLETKKNDDYWDSEYPKIDRLTYKPVPEDGSRVSMLEAGDVDLTYPLPEKDIDSLEGEDGIDVVKDESTVTRYATLNTQKAPLDDKKIREAMNYAIDQEQFSEVVKSGQAEKLDSPLPPPVKYHSEQGTYEQDLDKAKELMKEAGAEDGISLEVWGDDSSENKRAMQFIQQQLEEINVDVDIQQFERGTLDDKLNEPDGPEDADVQMWYVSWATTTGDTDNGLRPLFSSDAFPSSGANAAYYENEELDDLLDSARKQTEEDKAEKEYDEIQKIIYEDVPWLFLGVDKLVYAKNDNLKGAWLTPSGGFKMNESEIE